MPTCHVRVSNSKILRSEHAVSYQIAPLTWFLSAIFIILSFSLSITTKYRLAAAHWPVAELLDRPLANLLGQPVVVDAVDRSPSVLNGGLDKISPIYWATILLVASFIDLYQINKANFDPNYTSGNLGFDPLGLFPKDKEGQKTMIAKELRNGRLAMIAISAFAAQEYVSNSGIVDQFPF